MIYGKNKKNIVLNKSRGFTLIEVVVVMAIIAVLAVLIIGAIGIVRRQAKNTRLRNDAKTIKTALEAYYGKSGKYISWYVDQSAYRVAAPDASDGGLLSAFMPNGFPWYRPDSDAMADVCYTVVGPNDQKYELWVITEDRAANIVNTDGNTRKCEEDNLTNVPSVDNFSSI